MHSTTKFNMLLTCESVNSTKFHRVTFQRPLRRNNIHYN